MGTRSRSLSASSARRSRPRSSCSLNQSVAPGILCSVDDLLLLMVNMGSGRFALYDKDFDYYVYRAVAGDGDSTHRPSLQAATAPAFLLLQS